MAATGRKTSRKSLPSLLSGTPTSQRHQLAAAMPTQEPYAHDLDLFYIRQIASHMKEYDLEQKIDVEIRIREGTTKLLAACQHPSQALEAAKTLQTSNERMNAYMTELQSRKHDPSCSSPTSSGSSSGSSRTSPTVCPARLGLSDLRFPLMWKDTDHFKNRGDYRRFAVFCLAKVGTEVMDTSLVTPVDRSATDITFPDALVFTSAQPDFKLKLEVYSCMLQDDLSIASTPRKLQKSLHSSISRTLGRKLSATLKDAKSQPNDVGPKFDLVATATLGLSEVHDSIKSQDLVLENLENPCHQLPLFDHFCCRLAAQPECVSSEQTASVALKHPAPVKSGKAGKTGKAEPTSWAVLRGFTLDVWRKKEHRDKGRLPFVTVSLAHGATLTHGPERGELAVSAFQDCEERRVEFRCADAAFVSALGQRIADSQAWGQTVSRGEMEIHSPQMNGSPSNGRWAPRNGSLYEETPLFDEPKSRRRPTVHEVFNLPQQSRAENGFKTPGNNPTPPSPPNTRSRSSSTSTSSGSLPSWGSMRGLPNFWRFARASLRK